MTLIFDNPSVPSDLVSPKNLKLELLRAQDYESDGLTLHSATYDGNDILLDGSPLVTVANVKALDLTFDAGDNAFVVYTDTLDNVWVYSENDDSITDLEILGVNPRIHNDRQAQPNIILSYSRGNNVFYKLYEPAAPPGFIGTTGVIISDGGLGVTHGAFGPNAQDYAYCPTPVTGKRYFEMDLIVVVPGVGQRFMEGVGSEIKPNAWVGSPANCAYYFTLNGGLYGVLTGNNLQTGDMSGTIWGIAVDEPNKKLWIRDSIGNWTDGDPVTGVGGYSFSTMSGTETQLCTGSGGSNAGTAKTLWNLGGTPFTHSLPSGYLAGFDLGVGMFGPEIAVDDGSPLQVRTLTGAALGDNDRFQFRGLPITSDTQTSGYGVGQVDDP